MFVGTYNSVQNGLCLLISSMFYAHLDCVLIIYARDQTVKNFKEKKSCHLKHFVIKKVLIKSRYKLVII